MTDRGANDDGSILGCGLGCVFSIACTAVAATVLQRLHASTSWVRLGPVFIVLLFGFHSLWNRRFEGSLQTHDELARDQRCLRMAWITGVFVSVPLLGWLTGLWAAAREVVFSAWCIGLAVGLFGQFLLLRMRATGRQALGDRVVTYAVCAVVYLAFAQAMENG